MNLLRLISAASALVVLTMLLGAAVYESIVVAPNFQGAPTSLEHARGFYHVTNPGDILQSAIAGHANFPQAGWRLVSNYKNPVRCPLRVLAESTKVKSRPGLHSLTALVQIQSRNCICRPGMSCRISFRSRRLSGLRDVRHPLLPRSYGVPFHFRLHRA